MRTISVLMSTYNGEKFIEEQLNSILNQKKVNLKLIIRDDGSKDKTLNILKKYQERHGNISIISDGINKGACQSFVELMCKNYNTDYYALSDQDDVWDADKLHRAIEMIESKGNTVPILYYSNLRIVDEHNDFCRLSHGMPHIAHNKYAYLSESLPTGCTIVYNKALAEVLFDKKPLMCSMHDAWLYLVASAFGKCIYDFTPHINYRQHSGNLIGASKGRFTIATIKRELQYIFDDESQPRYTNAKEFYRLYSNDLDDETGKKVQCIIHYKCNLKNMLRVFFDKELNSDSLRRKVRFKIKILLHNV